MQLPWITILLLVSNTICAPVEEKSLQVRKPTSQPKTPASSTSTSASQRGVPIKGATADGSPTPSFSPEQTLGTASSRTPSASPTAPQLGPRPESLSGSSASNGGTLSNSPTLPSSKPGSRPVVRPSNGVLPTGISPSTSKLVLTTLSVARQVGNGEDVFTVSAKLEDSRYENRLITTQIDRRGQNAIRIDLRTGSPLLVVMEDMAFRLTIRLTGKDAGALTVERKLIGQETTSIADAKIDIRPLFQGANRLEAKGVTFGAPTVVRDMRPLHRRHEIPSDPDQLLGMELTKRTI
ncbi:Hypothetical protein D9617_15g042980 [Elsinoe fawcettii]|nr:Hypothetical protein D9617_15g042980 [Elsinoe fawcettii]